MIVLFTVPGQPVAKGRPRFARRGAGVVAYTPQKTANYEAQVRVSATAAMDGIDPIAGPLELSIRCVLQIPASWSKKKKDMAALGVVCATKKPDIDNVIKGIKDACNGVCWVDDAQVVKVSIEKRYGAFPCATVMITKLKGDAA